MKVVVTGGAGFIGSHLADALLARGDEVHVVDDLATGRRDNVPAGAAFHEGSITDPALLARVMRGATYVFHEAALGSVPRSVEDPLRTDLVNTHGTVCVLDAARRADVRKVVFAASSSAYGDTPTLPKHEGMSTNPKSPYAVSKVAGETYCRVFHEVYGLRTTALRYFNVYGPRQDPNGAYAAVIPRWILAALRGDPLLLHGTGEQTRDFTYVSDVVAANLLATESARADGRVVNVGRGEPIGLPALAELILRATGSRSTLRHGPPRAGDIMHSYAAQDLARDLLDHKPKVGIQEGIERTVAWFRQQGPAGRAT